MRTLAALAAAFLAVAAAPVVHAIDHGKGHPGFCKDDKGVTVVIDFQQLGGDAIVRCNPQPTAGTGLDAMKGAGFQVAGAQRWGEAFICRVENKPAAADQIPINGRANYRELCIDTPPAAAYWSYWHAGNNCAWDYSQWGVKNRQFIPGGFEGWSFSLNATADTNPVPRVAAVRPGTEGKACNAVEEAKPVSNDPNETQAPVQGRPPQATPEAERQETPPPGAPTGALPPPKPRASATARPKANDPSSNIAFSGGENAEDVNEVIKRTSGASDYAPWAAGGAVVVLLAAGFFVARRRKRVNES
ncbi:ABC transporter substrate-binding protein [Lentzea sp. NBC_00516]|uniref:ABC transporter substrate-binding protein n=1 Tax=Lentzea sp. NBC_00516 TaxID=2903582 RepID=UPI002E820AC1|nr:ABC transporter substrate-binding protein [Lentzea sp. NBC_00516]WUD26688.1 ABC transporter substrate-binding protein [Lentzea sp. NBC_00516]